MEKIFQYMFVHPKDNPKKPPIKVKRTREEMQTTLENKKKATIDPPRSALKRNNKVEEGKALGSGVKREQESTNLRAQKMMKGKMEPFAIPIVVRVVPPVVQVVRHTTSIPQMILAFVPKVYRLLNYRRR
jgi:hypothetical protein